MSKHHAKDFLKYKDRSTTWENLNNAREWFRNNYKAYGVTEEALARNLEIVDITEKTMEFWIRALAETDCNYEEFMMARDMMINLQLGNPIHGEWEKGIDAINPYIDITYKYTKVAKEAVKEAEEKDKAEKETGN